MAGRTKSPTTRRFVATIEAGRAGGALVRLPFDVEEVFGTKGRVPVRASFDGVDYRGSIAPMGGRHLLGVTKAIRASIGKDVGDEVRVELCRDDTERTVEIPAELLRALKRVKGAKARFDALSYTRRRESAELVTGAKKEETRTRRIEKILSELAD